MAPIDPLALFAGATIIPVLTIERAEDAAPLARALISGGLPVLEVTLRTERALAAIEAIARNVPEAVVGAGTVTQPQDIAAALDAGAKYLVSPGTPPDLAEALAAAAVPSLPGCSTVSEAMALARHGFRALKFFPAEASGGVGWLKAVAAPLPHLMFCPTGGIDAGNVARYLSLANVFAVGGSWVAPKPALAAHDFARITALARDSAKLRV